MDAGLQGEGFVKKIFLKTGGGGGVKFRGFKQGYMEKRAGGLGVERNRYQKQIRGDQPPPKLL